MMLLDPARGLVRSFANNPPYYDEPKLFCIGALLNLPPSEQVHADEVAPDLALGHAGGASLNKERALWKVAGEAAERYALLIHNGQPISSDFHSLGLSSALDPNTIVAGTERITPDRRSSVVHWLPGFNVYDGSEKWIPYQLVAVPHLFPDKEAVWRAPITTGAAAGFSLEEALYEGLCEVVERDAFMVAWLRQLQLIRLDPGDAARGDSVGALLAQTIAAALRYKLTPQFFLLPTGLPVVAVMCVVWDDTNWGPPITIGTKASHSVSSALLSALEEALQTRPWVRDLYDRRATVSAPDPTAINTLSQRAALWFSGQAVSKLRQWLESASPGTTAASLPADGPSCSLKQLAASIQYQGGSVWGINLTTFMPGAIRELGLHVVKAIVPEYQPLYLIEELNDYAWGRLTSAEERLKVTAKQPTEMPFSFPHPLL